MGAQLCENTKIYLNKFYEILDEMIQKMTQVRLTDSVSQNFICQMIPHHRAAIEMCRNVLRFTQNGAIREIACHIIEEQTRSIANMEKAFCPCGNVCNTREALCDYQRNFQGITRTMFTEMGNACADNNIDANFLREMIPHHEGAVRMGRNAQCQAICQELQPIISAIITSQEEGICRMKRLLACMEQ